MENSLENNLSQANYLSFEELIDDFIQKPSELIFDDSKNLDWKAEFDNIDILRKMNKFLAPKEFLEVLNKNLKYIIRCVENLRSNISKNGLILIKEILKINPFVFFEENIMENFLIILFEKSIIEKIFIKNEAKLAIEVIENQLGLQEKNLLILNKLLNDKNPNICEKISDSLVKIAINNEKESFNEEIIVIFLRIIFKMISNGRMVLKKNAEKILDILENKREIEVLNNILMKNFEKNEFEMILDCIEKKKNRNKPKESIKDFLNKKNGGKNSN